MARLKNCSHMVIDHALCRSVSFWSHGRRATGSDCLSMQFEHQILKLSILKCPMSGDWMLQRLMFLLFSCIGVKGIREMTSKKGHFSRMEHCNPWHLIQVMEPDLEWPEYVWVSGSFRVCTRKLDMTVYIDIMISSWALYHNLKYCNWPLSWFTGKTYFSFQSIIDSF